MGIAKPVSGIRVLPIVVISLDFELRWGMHDVLQFNIDAYRENLENERIVVPALLKLFVERNIHCTWATVGAIGCSDWNEYFSRAPEPPKYHNPALAVNPRYADLDPQGVLHFAPELLRLIHETNGQELGTHTFSHLYMRELGVTAEDVAADLAAVSLLWKERFGAPPKSLVFPRNQVAFLPVIRASSIRIWRSNPKPWYYECNKASTNRWLPRALRLLDVLNPLARRVSVPEGDMTRSSLFLRVNIPKYLWKLQVLRVEKELNAIRPGEIFHIWWHPHNIGFDINFRLNRVKQVLDMIAEKCRKGLLTSQCMEDLI